MMHRKVVLVRRPVGEVRASDFSVEEAELPPLGDGQVLLQVSRVSIDAFIRTTLEEGSFHATAALGNPVTALGVGQVLESKHAPLAAGDWVVGPTLAQTHALMPGALFHKIDASVAPPSAYLGLLGMTTGLTAYFGMFAVGKVEAGDTVVVSAAAGAVGTVASQLAKIKGAKVIGVAGGAAKCRYLLETIGLDGAVDYKGEDPAARLDALAPEGIDVYFDNVGGELLDTVLDRLRTGARVAICGAISQYQHMSDMRGPKLYLRLAERNATMGGFTVDHYASQFGPASAELADWMQSGQLKLPEHVETGIERFPEALMMLFNGGHMGKLLVAP